MSSSLKSRIVEYYEKNETKVDLGFFLGGFVFDILTLSSIDDPIAIAQQLLYLFVIGSFLYFEFLQKCEKWSPTGRIVGIWNYRSLIIHFLLGSLLSVYSLFFLKSSSLFSSIIFVVILLGVMVANELKSVQKSDVSLKMGLFVICLFSFFSLIIPVLLGFVGWTPFLLSLACTLGVLILLYKRLQKRVSDPSKLIRFLMAPGTGVLILFLVFYLFGWIPPVPISITNMGVYHNLEVENGTYRLSYERPWWKFWQNGDQTFKARPGDKIVFFVQIFSPSRFDDQVLLNWNFYHPKRGWLSSDRIPIRIVGGRSQGFRGYTVKQNFEAGQWRVLVETTNGHEIGRMYFDVEKVGASEETRDWRVDVY